jgi:hypothetical protein
LHENQRRLPEYFTSHLGTILQQKWYARSGPSEFLADLLVEGRRSFGCEREVVAALGERANHFFGRDVSRHFVLREGAAAERGVETAATEQVLAEITGRGPRP